MAILGPYAAAIRTLVQVELELFRSRVLGGAALPALPLPDIARDATALGERLVVAMRAKLVVPELRALAAPPGRPIRQSRGGSPRNLPGRRAPRSRNPRG
jgi:hypothetical protein